jgi:hypothetical protein
MDYLRPRSNRKRQRLRRYGSMCLVGTGAMIPASFWLNKLAERFVGEPISLGWLMMTALIILALSIAATRFSEYLFERYSK